MYFVMFKERGKLERFSNSTVGRTRQYQQKGESIFANYNYCCQSKVIL